MVCYVAGSNIFGQWPWSDYVSKKFCDTALNKQEIKLPKNASKILQVNWSYNLLKVVDRYIVSGFWDGQDHQFVEIPLPNEYSDINKNEDLIVVGNDYYLLLVNKSTKTLWIKDLKMEKNIKKIKFNIEEPVENVEKKQKIDDSITKVVLANDSCLYLTTAGNVYNGILPSYVDTRHCKGKICDIHCGYEHFMLLTNTGQVYTWGNGRRLQLGHGEISSLDVPTEVEALAGIKITKITAGGWHSLALSEFGDLYAWGWNDIGQLGIKHESEGHKSYAVPTLVDIYDSKGNEVTVNIKDIACGSRHSAILMEDNTVWTTGCNKYGQLGFSDEKYSKIGYFFNAFQCAVQNCTLMCGPWTTVIVSN